MVFEDFELSAIWMIILLIVIIWSAVWKLLGMWRAVKNDSKVWFIVLAIINTVGILPILYIYVFGKQKEILPVTPKKSLTKSPVKSMTKSILKKPVKKPMIKPVLKNKPAMSV